MKRFLPWNMDAADVSHLDSVKVRCDARHRRLPSSATSIRTREGVHRHGGFANLLMVDVRHECAVTLLPGRNVRRVKDESRLVVRSSHYMTHPIAVHHTNSMFGLEQLKPFRET